MKEFPGCSISLELAGVRFDQFRASFFIRINTRAIFLPRFVSFQPGRLHSPLFYQPVSVPHIDRAPNAGWCARREANHVTLRVNFFANAIDPSEAEGFVDRFGPGDAGLAGIFSVEADPKFF